MLPTDILFTVSLATQSSTMRDNNPQRRDKRAALVLSPRQCKLFIAAVMEAATTVYVVKTTGVVTATENIIGGGVHAAAAVVHIM